MATIWVPFDVKSSEIGAFSNARFANASVETAAKLAGPIAQRRLTAVGVRRGQDSRLDPSVPAIGRDHAAMGIRTEPFRRPGVAREFFDPPQQEKGIGDTEEIWGCGQVTGDWLQVTAGKNRRFFSDCPL
jgi:hypothetical protein